MALMNLAENGGHIVSSASLYGGTYNQLHYTFPKLGMEVSFVDDPDDLDAWRAAIRPNTKAFYGEIIGNPKGDVFDFEGVVGDRARQRHPARDRQHAGVARTCAVRSSTAPTSWCTRPRSSSAATARRSAGSSSTAGSSTTWRSGRFPGFTEPDPSYHGSMFSQLPEPLRPAQYILKCRLQYQRDIGPAIVAVQLVPVPPGARDAERCAWSGTRENALAVAQWLEARDEVEWVKYPGLASSPWNERAQKYLPNGARARSSSFGIEGGLEAGQKFVDALELHSHLANVGDVRSLAIHPATTTHQQLDADEQATTGVTPDLVRLSVGIECSTTSSPTSTPGFRAAKA